MSKMYENFNNKTKIYTDVCNQNRKIAKNTQQPDLLTAELTKQFQLSTSRIYRL